MALALAGVLACSASLDPEDFALAPGDPPPVTTDASVYTLTRFEGGYAAEAVATYTNTTGHTVFYERCLPESTDPVYGLRRTGTDSTAPAVVGVVWACVGGVPKGRVRPGGTLTTRVSLGSADSPQAEPPITPDQRIGRFRIVLALCTDDSGQCAALPLSARESSEFEIRLTAP